MSNRKQHYLVIITTTIFLLFNSMTQAQEADFTTPQPQHEFLERFSGVWEFERRTAPGDESEPQVVGTGEVRAELLGKFFIVSRWSGKIMGFDFEGAQTLGYDVVQEQYFGTWADSILSFHWDLSGSHDTESDEFILQGSGPSPTGYEGTFRERYQFKSPESLIIVAEMLQDDNWVKFMETRLVRKN